MIRTFFDENRFLVDPYLVDSNLIGLNIPEKGTVELLVSSGEAVFVLQLSEVRYFRAYDFLEGNIIAGVQVWKMREVPNFLFEDLLSGGTRESIERTRDSLLKDAFNFFALDATFGCWVRAAFKRFEIISR